MTILTPSGQSQAYRFLVAIDSALTNYVKIIIELAQLEDEHDRTTTYHALSRESQEEYERATKRLGEMIRTEERFICDAILGGLKSNQIPISGLMSHEVDELKDEMRKKDFYSVHLDKFNAIFREVENRMHHREAQRRKEYFEAKVHDLLGMKNAAPESISEALEFIRDNGSKSKDEVLKGILGYLHKKNKENFMPFIEDIAETWDIDGAPRESECTLYVFANSFGYEDVKLLIEFYRTL